MDGGDLSFKVHALTEYIRENFGMEYLGMPSPPQPHFTRILSKIRVATRDYVDQGNARASSRRVRPIRLPHARNAQPPASSVGLSYRTAVCGPLVRWCGRGRGLTFPVCRFRPTQTVQRAGDPARRTPLCFTPRHKPLGRVVVTVITDAACSEHYIRLKLAECRHRLSQLGPHLFPQPHV